MTGEFAIKGKRWVLTSMDRPVIAVRDTLKSLRADLPTVGLSQTQRLRRVAPGVWAVSVFMDGAQRDIYLANNPTWLKYQGFAEAAWAVSIVTERP